MTINPSRELDLNDTEFSRHQDGLRGSFNLDTSNRVASAAATGAPAAQRSSSFGMSPLLKESGSTRDYVFDSVSASAYSPPAQDPQRILRSMMSLCKHIYSRGLIEGSGSDLTIRAFGKDYHLHRIILFQNSYFSSLLEGPWRENGANAIELRFDDENITRDAFEIALERMYGRLDENIAPSQVLNLLATASYLDLQDLCEMCVEVILRDIKDDTVVDYLNFATSQCYGTHTDKITEACFTYLCRDGYDNAKIHQAFLALPAEWLKRVIESDAFWVPSEYERYLFSRDIVSKRRKIAFERKRQQVGSSDAVNSDIGDPMEISIPTSPTTCSTPRIKRLSESAFTYHTQCSDNSTPVIAQPAPPEGDEAVYLTIFTYAIYYGHMTLEELQSIQNDRDPITKMPFSPDSVVKDALWQQIDLRNKIETAAENEFTLGISSSEIPPNSTAMHFEIPSDDTTHIGEALTGLEDTITGTTKPIKDGEGRRSVEYSLFAPFRFSVEFADVAKLKEKQRVYSKTKFYAGSNWNMYIQKIKTPRKGIQLGVYLHRHSMPDPHSNTVVSGSSKQPNSPPTPTPGLEGEQYSTPRSQTLIRNNDHEYSFSRYADKRKTVRTWFKIFCPSRGPSHVMTQFQSSPDNFALMQSWGWRSSSLCQDDYLVDVRDFDGTPGSMSSTGSSTLKFSVVMGHV